MLFLNVEVREYFNKYELGAKLGYTFTRKELYEKVWSEPLSTLAPKFGISDVALGKACRKARVPRPERGYWAKKSAGKPTVKAILEPRFPGASDAVKIGPQDYSNSKSDLLNKPLPDPPTFQEDIDVLRERIKKMVGKVAYPRMTNKVHPIVDIFLKQDAERKSDSEERGYSWNKPRFDSPIERRRLRVLSAIFLNTQRLGCKPGMSTSEYDQENREASIDVGDQRVSFTLKAIQSKGRGKNTHKPCSERLSLSIKGNSRTSGDRYTWIDTDDLKIEKLLGDIVVEIIMTGEFQYRELVQWHYDWDVQRKAELLEEERQRRIEEERKARELREQQEQARIDRLLSEAVSLQKAETIRNYVAEISANVGKIDAPIEDIEKWVLWALAQADRIDPIKNPSFLKIVEEEISNEDGDVI